MPSLILIHPTIWQQNTNITDRQDRQTDNGLIAQTVTQKQQQPFYGHYPRQPAFGHTSSSELEDFLKQSFTARVPLLTATSTFGLGRRHYSSPQ